MDTEVVDPHGAKFFVDLEGQACTCKFPHCAHWSFVRDISKGRKNVLYEHLSGLHKELRRSDTVRAIQHGMILEKLYGPKVVQSYLRKIVFEETRNINLAKCLDSPWQEGIHHFGMTTKKWELPSWSLIKKAKAYLASVESPIPNRDSNYLFTQDGFYEALAELFRIRRFDKRTGSKQRLAAAFYGAKKYPKSYLAELTNQSGSKLSFYQWIAALSELYGQLDSSISIKESMSYKARNWLFMPAPYCFDNHTAIGARLIKKHWHGIKPESPNPGNLDARWGGGIRSTIWRECAVKQFGTDRYREQPWEAVAISDEDWRIASIFDAYFYPDLYSKLEPNLCLESSIDLGGR